MVSILLYFYSAHELAVGVVFEMVVGVSVVKVSKRARAFFWKNKLIQVFFKLRVFNCRSAEPKVSFEFGWGWEMTEKMY